MASGVMAEAGAMVPTSDSELTCWSKVSVVQPMNVAGHNHSPFELDPFVSGSSMKVDNMQTSAQESVDDSNGPDA